MPKIHVLSELLVRQIAAGEVVERPASVVKELVENSLDAGARKIEVFLEGGGLEAVTVLDDGCGMDAADAELAFERHATSKIRRAEDLEGVESMGFRGEALAAIASVAKVRLLTAPGNAASGTEVTVEGGARASARPAAARPGTRVEARELFFNVPARRKFMRGAQAEQRRAAEVFARLALAHPEQHFLLHGEKKILLDAPPAASFGERALQVLGRDAAEGMREFALRDGCLAAEGLVSSPQKPASSRDRQFFFVNRRPVQDRLLSAAFLRAYPTLPSGTHPAFVIYLNMPAGAVDVNVHPAKTEVRFRDSSPVFRLIQLAVEKALGPGAWLSSPGFASRAAASFPLPSGEPPAFPAAVSAFDPAPPSAAVRERALSAAASAEAAPSMMEAMAPRPLAQYAGTYILAEDARGLLLVDQHVAHERVLYEKLLKAFSEGRLHRQALLIPADVELPASLDAEDPAMAARLARLGFEAEPFGRHALRVRAVPALAASGGIAAMVLDLAQRAESAPGGEGTGPSFDPHFASMACRSAVVKNTPLSPEKMREILRDWTLARCPSVCPHGRPVALRYSLEEIERDFGRR
jgi:DNA mismatch repair protein MutL